MNRDEKKSARNRLWTMLKEKYPLEHLPIADAEQFIGLNRRRIGSEYNTFFFGSGKHIRIEEVVRAVAERQGLD